MDNHQSEKSVLQNIFNEVQRCNAKKYLEHLYYVKEKMKQDLSKDELLAIVYPILLCERPVLPAKLFLFVKRSFEEASRSVNGMNLLLGIFKELVILSDSKIVHVRKNSLALLDLILRIEQFKVEGVSAFEKLSERLFDKIKSVRKKAVILLSRYQNITVNRTTKIVTLFKNLLRHGSSLDIRRLVFEHIEVNAHTYNCILERMTDIDLKIRTVFYKKYLDKIDIRMLDKETKILLLRNALCEREIDGFDNLYKCCEYYYDLPAEFPDLVYDFYDTKYLGLLQKLANRLFASHPGDCDFNITHIQSPDIVLHYYLHLAYTDDLRGRDYIRLHDLSTYVESVYNYTKNARTVEEKETVKILFKILRYYDVFDTESKKILNSCIYKMLNTKVSIEFLEELVSFVYHVDPANGDKLFGKLIYKHLKIQPEFSLLLCKYILKYSKSNDEIQQAIINEVVVKFEIPLGCDNILLAEILFYYLILEQDGAIYDLFCKFLNSEKNIIGMHVDLAVFYKSKIYIDTAIEVMQSNIDKDNHDIVIPCSKLLLHNLVDDYRTKLKYICYALKCLYNEVEDKLQQYMTIFVQEYFTNHYDILIDAFCDIYPSLRKNENKFVNHIVYVLDRERESNNVQRLQYNICVYLLAHQQDRKLCNKLKKAITYMRCHANWCPILAKEIEAVCEQFQDKQFASDLLVNITRAHVNRLAGMTIASDDMCNDESQSEYGMDLDSYDM